MYGPMTSAVEPLEKYSSVDAGWEHLPHDADIRLRARGPTLAAAFEQAALAMTAVITNPSAILRACAVDVACDAPDRELLLVEWLNALVYEMATRNMLFGRFQVETDGTRLHAVAWGESVDRRRHRPIAEIKGATYTALHVAEEPDGSWVAECVVDV